MWSVWQAPPDGQPLAKDSEWRGDENGLAVVQLTDPDLHMYVQSGWGLQRNGSSVNRFYGPAAATFVNSGTGRIWKSDYGHLGGRSTLTAFGTCGHYASDGDQTHLTSELAAYKAVIGTDLVIDEMRWWHGFFDVVPYNAVAASIVSSCAAFHYTSAGSGNIEFHTATTGGGAIESTTATGVSFAQDQVYMVAIDFREFPTNIKAWIDGVQVAEHDTSLPSAADTLQWENWNYNNAGVVHRGLLCNDMRIWGRLS